MRCRLPLRPGGSCPRCGAEVPVAGTGRPRKWCSQRCRRAAYEERRAAAAGAMAIELVQPATIEVEHNLTECRRGTTESPTACRLVLQSLTTLAYAQAMQDDPKWEATVLAALDLANALTYRSATFIATTTGRARP